MFVIKIGWIKANRTTKGAWTRRQLAAIGVSWPPAQGWPARVVGTAITDEQKAQFEQDADQRAYVIDHTMMPTGKTFSSTLRCRRCAGWGVLLAADTVAQAEADLLFAQRQHHVSVHAG